MFVFFVFIVLVCLFFCYLLTTYAYQCDICLLLEYYLKPHIRILSEGGYGELHFLYSLYLSMYDDTLQSDRLCFWLMPQPHPLLKIFHISTLTRYRHSLNRKNKNNTYKDKNKK